MLYVLFLAIVCALAVGHPGRPPNGSIAWPVGLTLLFAMVPPLLGWAAVRRINRLEEPSRTSHGSRCVQWLAAAWTAAALAIVFLANWPGLVHACWPSNRTVLCGDALVLLPILCSWIGCWAILWPLFEHQQAAAAAEGRWSFVWAQARLTIVLGWAPVLMFCAIHDSLLTALPELSSTRANFTVFLLNLCGLLVLFPWFLSMIWETRRLPDGPLRSRLEQLARQADLKFHEILLWDTQDRIANAAVTGVLPSTRRVFLSDALLNHFSDDEIEAAFAHEMGHARLNHPFWRMAILAVPVSMLVLCTAIPVRIELWAGLDPSLLLLVGVIAYLFVALGWYSRRLEHEADLWACRLLATHLGQPRALGQYLEVLLRLSDPRHRHRGSWLHPGHNRRRAFLISKLANQRRADAFQREMKWLALLVGALVVLPLVVVFAP